MTMVEAFLRERDRASAVVYPASPATGALRNASLAAMLSVIWAGAFAVRWGWLGA